ncbi:MAG: cobalamin-dependent protein [Planctomycetaceae bacterium]|jgi:5-methyltetrahydrofolate--homocysteine methyltransferase|nr:cobalamin-dependent protein [Planctomycetaceae bacterium]
MPEKLKNAIAHCETDTVMAEIQTLLGNGTDAKEIVNICNAGMELLGERFDQGEAFIPDLMFGGVLMKQAMDKLAPFLKLDADEQRNKKTLVIGTVRHDVHNIGKDITAMVFRSSGFNVVDLGVDVPPEKFVAAIQEHKPDFVGMSVLLTTCYKSVIETMEAVKNAGLRSAVNMCVGGAAASGLLAERVGADFYGKTAIDTLNWAKGIAAQKNSGTTAG